VENNASLVFVVPGSLETRTGGYEYDRRIIAGLRALGWSVETRELDDSFPRPSAAALAGAARVFASLPDRVTVLVDGLALGAMPAEVECAAGRLRLVALVHLPLAAEIGLDPEEAAALRSAERRALAASSMVVVTGRSSLAAMVDYGLRPDRIVVVEPGTARSPLARGSDNGTLRLLCVATFNRGKGHSILFRALRSIADHDWQLACVGSLDRDRVTVQRLRDQLQADGLDERVVLTGALDERLLDEWYDRSDLFVLATLQETFGMAVAEAIARGLPVVSTRTGAIPDLVGEDAGMLVPPGDENAFAAALREVVADGRLRARLAEGARRRREQLQPWENTAREMSAALMADRTNGGFAL
jgi:glycosyltransferase involved in cell wall biosynthesis